MKKFLFPLLLVLAASCTPVPSARWIEGPVGENGRAAHTLVLNNVPAGSRVWFQELFDGKTNIEGPAMHHYQGTSWSAALENAPISSLPLTAKAIGDAGEAHSLSVQTAVDLDTMCVPYYSLQEKGLDSYVPNRRNSYRVDHLLFRGALEELSLSGRDAQNEKEYADFAHAYYTQLPQDTRDAMLAYCDRAGLSPSDPNIVELVAAYIQSVGVYRLDTQPYPSTDYAMYFLSDAREGYCIHFTTAATVMYRALGIPARVTEGFLVDVESLFLQFVDLVEDGLALIDGRVFDGSLQLGNLLFLLAGRFLYLLLYLLRTGTQFVVAQCLNLRIGCLNLLYEGLNQLHVAC